MALYIDSVAHILQLLKDSFGTDFKSYYDGDPDVIGESSLPAVSVKKESGKSSLGPTQFDNKVETIVIKIIYNKRDDWGASDDVDLTDRKLRYLVEGIDPTTGLYLTNSILSVLRTNITMQQTSLEQEEEVAYGVVPRNQKEEFYTSECHIKVTLRRYIQIPGRT